MTRDGAREAFESSRGLVLDAFKGIDESRARHVFATPPFGTISLYQVGDFLAAHVARHNAQLKRLLGR
jgi:hypothetical protein